MAAGFRPPAGPLSGLLWWLRVQSRLHQHHRRISGTRHIRIRPSDEPEASNFPSGEKETSVYWCVLLYCPVTCCRAHTTIESRSPHSWTLKLSRQVRTQRCLFHPISARTIGRIWEEADLKPHRSRYWLNTQPENPAALDAQVRGKSVTSISRRRRSTRRVSTVSVAMRRRVSRPWSSRPPLDLRRKAAGYLTGEGFAPRCTRVRAADPWKACTWRRWGHHPEAC